MGRAHDAPLTRGRPAEGDYAAGVDAPVKPAPHDPQHALLDAIFQHAPVGLAFWDHEMRYRRINEALAAINGPSAEDHIGKTMPEVLGVLGEDLERLFRQILADGEPRANLDVEGETPAVPGEIRHWLASYYPVVGEDGETVGIAAAVIENTAQHRAEAEQIRLLKEAVTARAHAEAAQIRAEAAQATAEAARRRTEFLAEASRRMGASMNETTVLQEVTEIAVPAIADWCSITVVRRDGGLETAGVAHFDPAKTEWARRLGQEYPPRITDVAGSGAAVRTGEMQLITEVTDELLAAAARDPEHLEILEALGVRAALTVPLRIGGHVIGALSFAIAESDRAFDADDVSLALSLAGRAALHIRNAQLYTERSHIARTLQAGLLPRALPEIDGMEVAARYLAAGDQNEVGGDFYDVFPSEDGVWTALIGDVTGKGPEAAALTSLARHTLRTAALSQAGPAANLHLLNRAMLADADSSRFCTVVYARMCPSDGHAVVTVASGGHPPPIVLRADGTVEHVETSGTLVGGVPDPVFEDVELRLEAGDLMLLYTDGVTELRTSDPEFGERHLVETVGRMTGASADELVEAVERAAVEAQVGAPRDDIALLAVRVAVSAGAEP